VIPTDSTWHELEHSGYVADLATWAGLAAPSRVTRVLELGCGTGRVLHTLSDRSESLIGVDCSAEFLRSLRAATHPGASVHTIIADAPELPQVPLQDLIIGPALFVQLLTERSDRLKLFEWVARSLTSQGVAAFAVSPDLRAISSALLLTSRSSSDNCSFGATSLTSTVTSVNLADGVAAIERARFVNGVETGASSQFLAAVSIEEISSEALSAGLVFDCTIDVAPSSRHAGVKVLVFNAPN